MIISEKYAKRLIATGKAKSTGHCIHDGERYMIIDRIDLQRTDHAGVK